MDKQAIAKYLDHTLLKANATYEQLQAVSERIGVIMEQTDEKEFRLLELYEMQ